jgi:hypothetical protein
MKILDFFKDLILYLLQLVQALRYEIFSKTKAQSKKAAINVDSPNESSNKDQKLENGNIQTIFNGDTANNSSPNSTETDSARENDANTIQQNIFDVC